MHLATYTMADAGKMLAHYERAIGERDHIDKNLGVVNFAPAWEKGQQARFKELTKGIEIGAKTRPLADIVVTKPKDFEGDLLGLFQGAYDLLESKVGKGRVVSAYVHFDEPGAEVHMHFAFVPLVNIEVMTNDKTQPLKWTKKDEQKNPEHKAGTVKKDSKGTVRYKRVPKLDADGNPVMRRTATASKLFSKADMAELHPAMEKHLCERLGVERVGMVLDEEDDRKKWSKLDHEDFERVTAVRKAVEDETASLEERRHEIAVEKIIIEVERDDAARRRDAVKAEADEETRRLESVRRDREAADARVAGLRERVAAARTAAGECSPQPARQSVAEDAREVFEGRSLKAEEEQLREEVRALEQRQRALKDEVRGLGNRIRELVASIETVKDRVIAKCREGIRVDRMPRNLANMLFNLLDRKRVEGRMRAGGEWASIATGSYVAAAQERHQARADAPRWEPQHERGRGARR